jgi:hypothetical protein
VGDVLTAAATLAGALGAVWVWLRGRRARAMRRPAHDLLDAFGVAGTGALVLAFTTATCSSCKTVQRPELESLVARHRDRLTVREVDAIESPDLARRFGILTVPSTVVIDPRGRVTAINYGPAPAARLAGQAGLNGARAAAPPT